MTHTSQKLQFQQTGGGLPNTEPTVTNISITVVSGNQSQGTFSVEVFGDGLTIHEVKLDSMEAMNGEPDPKNGQIPRALSNVSGDTWTGIVKFSGDLEDRASDAYEGELKIGFSSPEPNPEPLSFITVPYISGVQS